MNFAEKRDAGSGVSESIGFLLIFGMVIVGIGLVTLYGYPMLLQQQTSADKQIMEKNMIVLQNDMKSLAYKTVPYKETSLNIGGGTLTVHNASNSNTFLLISGGSFNENFPLGDLQYHSVSSDSEITIENGAVVMRALVEPGSTMLAQPRWFYDSRTNTMVVNLISLNSSYNIARTGVGTVQMTLSSTNYSVTEGINTDVCVEYRPDPATDYSKAWDNYFSSVMNLKQTASCSGTLKYQLVPVDNLLDSTPTPATLVIKKYDIEIKSL